MSNKDLVAKVGGYIKDGQQKSRYMKIGVLVTKDDGAFALIDPTVNFAGILLRQNMMQETDRDSVMISIFDQERPAKVSGFLYQKVPFREKLSFFKYHR